MTNIKTILSVIGIVLTFVAYVPYIRDTVKGKTKPHVFSWIIWAITTGIIYALQASAGAGSGAWITLTVALIMFTIVFLSLKGGEKNIKPVDVVFFILALVALALCVLVHQPLLSIILLTTIDMLGFASTFRKSWENPYSETLSTYAINGFRSGLAFFALAEYNIITSLSSVSWTIANGLFVAMLVIRRRK